ncbi:dihydroxyacetone kinase subunit DhaK [Nocardioides lianchengensis]|uniref:Dihydroxyacetone kinase n=1 Tax=Nocardioides lianchengensis TaxID=1045774 RepID=A0A1G6I9I3_9ACTN|nr:dihydroxyacetone kinase subunit DhaK [Nocardioides lianchengensis]NYG13120.1 dihydroxyacetone kinase [Nocardioides lianchengensis]SDC03154.1 dihydroxyacetone kinase [Nocardioides lianchengensis]
MARSFLTDGVSPSAHALEGVALASGHTVGTSPAPSYVWALRPAPERQVALVSGGGAGHEPMHAGFVGAGGLDAAAPGEVFTSPHNRQVYAASARVARPGGVIHVVKNYTGDRINFAIAAERLRAEGHRVAEVLVDDDLGSEGHEVGRRGTGATVVVEKVLGAAADTGATFDDLVTLGRRVVDRSRTLAVAHGAQTSPETGEPAFDVAPGALEYGVGIHGETAAESIDQPDLGRLVDRMVGDLLAALPASEDGYLLLVNGLGGTGNLELAHVATEAARALDAAGRRLRSVETGTYVSALDMRGFSITLTAAEESWLAHWWAPHDTVALPSPRELGTGVTAAAEDPAPATGGEPSPWLAGLAATFEARRPGLNALDQRAGDGDIGTNLDNGLQAAVRRAPGPEADLAADLAAVAGAFLDDVGGSSGPLFGLVFQAVAAAVEGADDPSAALVTGLREGQEAVTRVGGAVPGDRTLLDALAPAVAGQRLDREAVAAAVAGARETARLVARRGRASYLGDRALGVADPGAVAVALLLSALLEHLDGSVDDDLRTDLDELVAGR